MILGKNEFVHLANNEEGVTLVEMMVVSAVLMTLALGFATMMKNQTVAQAVIRERAERTNMESATRASASSTTAVERSMMVVDP